MAPFGLSDEEWIVITFLVCVQGASTIRSDGRKALNGNF